MTRDDAIKEIDNLRNDIGSAYDDADQSPMWYALGMAIEALDTAEKQEKIERHLLRIAETFEKVNEAITDIADHFGSQMAMIIDTLEPIAKAFRDDDEAAADADDTCDNDCEHCDWVTCPKEEAANEQ